MSSIVIGWSSKGAETMHCEKWRIHSCWCYHSSVANTDLQQGTCLESPLTL